MTFKKVNNITGWVICAIASLVYILSAEANGSFWDCGAFVASAFLSARDVAPSEFVIKSKSVLY